MHITWLDRRKNFLMVPPSSKESSTKSIRNIHQTHVLRATFTNKPVIIFPDFVYGRIILACRSTDTAGARKDDGQNLGLVSSEDIRNANDLVVKFSWPEEIRVLRVTLFHRLEIKYLDDKHMLIAFTDRFFCEFFCGLCVIPLYLFSGRSLVTGGATHRAWGYQPDIRSSHGAGVLNQRSFNGLVSRRYRHDAGSFAWSLICICMRKDEKSNRHHQAPPLIIAIHDHVQFLIPQNHAYLGRIS